MFAWVKKVKENVKIIIVNHQIRKTQTIIETVQAKLSRSHRRCRRFLWDFIMGELTNRILEICVFLLEPSTGSLLRTDVRVLSESVLCVGGHNAVANEAWVNKISEVWDQMTFIDKYDITWHTTNLRKDQITMQCTTFI